MVGITGQVASALPLLLITIFLSRMIGLEQAGLFTIVVGSSAVVFSFSLWGLRTVIVRDRLQRFPEWEYLVIRFAAVLMASGITVFLGLQQGLAVSLVCVVVLFRACDSIIDLNLAFDQVWFNGGRPLFGYSIRHVGKLTVLITAIGIAYVLRNNNVYFVFAVSGLLSLILVVLPLLNFIRSKATAPRGIKRQSILRILKEASWFALAAAACAAITGAPRIAIDLFYDGEVMGVIGVSLSVTTFFGMMYNTTWVRFFPRFAQAEDIRRLAITFICENLVISALLALCSWYILPVIVGFVFGFSAEALIDLSRGVLVTSTMFFLGQVVANLFKLTIYPWMEFLVYFTGLLVPAIFAVLSDFSIGIPTLLLLSGTSMFSLSLLVFIGIKPSIHQDYEK